MGYKELLLRIKDSNSVYAKVGYPEEGTVREPTNPDEEKPALNDMGEIATIAAVHEFGSPENNIPERSHLRAAFDENEQILKDAKVILLRQVFDNKMTLKSAMQKLAVMMEAKVKNKIVSGPFVPLFPETIIRRNKHGRASDKPLIDTSQMINSVQSVVLEKRPE